MPTRQNLSLARLNPSDRELAEVARNASANAYAPYSGFAVGAAVRTKTGKIYFGANVENAAFAASICAEISAIAAAASAGDYDLETIAIVGHKFTPPESSAEVTTPCGRCRQVIVEAAQLSGHDIRVLSCSGDLTQILESKISELLPHAFGPKNIGLSDRWIDLRSKLHMQISKMKYQGDEKLKSSEMSENQRRQAVRSN